jgi:hypothetical protein
MVDGPSSMAILLKMDLWLPNNALLIKQKPKANLVVHTKTASQSREFKKVTSLVELMENQVKRK